MCSKSVENLPRKTGKFLGATIPQSMLFSPVHVYLCIEQVFYAIERCLCHKPCGNNKYRVCIVEMCDEMIGYFSL